jgi:hypothetical protein
MQLNDSVQLVWAMANREACLAKSPRIEPVHFLLASLTILDGFFEDAAHALSLSHEAVSAIFRIAEDCRGQTQLTDDQVTAARRAIRKTLRSEGEMTDFTFLHRSPESRFVFQRAGRRTAEAGDAEMTLFHLFCEILSNLPAEAKPHFPGATQEVSASSDEWPDYIGGLQ